MISQSSTPNYQLPLIVIAGPTASGKTALAIELAKRYNGEIVCADSRTIYKGMDIGTAKPSLREQAEVEHHLLDIVDPGEKFTVAQFKNLANQSIANIKDRDKTPFLVGGTGLYIDSVILDYQFPNEIDEAERLRLGSLTIESLIAMYNKQRLELPENSKNKRHLINGLLRSTEIPSRKARPGDDIVVVGISTEMTLLRKRIEQRAYTMFEMGVVEEAQKLAQKYGWEIEAMKGNVYPLIRQYLQGEIDKQLLIEKTITRDYRLAKRQMTWFRRHDFIRWHDLTLARDYLSTILDRY